MQQHSLVSLQLQTRPLPMGIGAVLTKIIQEQQKAIEEQKKAAEDRQKEHQRTISVLSEKMAQFEQAPSIERKFANCRKMRVDGGKGGGMYKRLEMNGIGIFDVWPNG